MLELDERHKKILEILNPQNEWTTHNQLWKETVFNKKTFHKKLYELVDMGLVERKPLKSEKRGMKVWFKITIKGRKRVETETLLVKIKNYATNSYEEMVKESLKSAEHKEVLHGQVTFLISKDLPICTIAHFPSRKQYEKLKPFFDSKERCLEIGMLINRVIEFYVSEKENEVYADYYSERESIFTMSFLSREMSKTMKEAKENGLFKEYWYIQKRLTDIVESIWLQIWQSILKGKPIILVNGFCYNASQKVLEVIPKTEVIEKLKRVLRS